MSFTYPIMDILAIEPLRNVPNETTREVELDKGVSPDEPYVLIKWDFPRHPKTGRKLPTSKDSWEPLANVDDKEMKKVWIQNFENKMRSRKRQLPPSNRSYTTQTNRKRRVLTPPTIDISPNIEPVRMIENISTLQNNSTSQKPIAVRTIQTEQGKMKIQLLKFQRHPSMNDVPAVLVEESFENGTSHRYLASIHTLSQNWNTSIIETLARGVKFNE